MKWAGEFSKDMGATLRLVHVIPGMEGVPSRQMDREFEEEMRKKAWQTIERLQESAGIKMPMCVVVGNVAETVRDEARRHEADLVVIGRGTLQGTFGRLRTYYYEIIWQSP
jgi:nucleotide-binding universal stress UspA family protein